MKAYTKITLLLTFVSSVPLLHIIYTSFSTTVSVPEGFIAAQPNALLRAQTSDTGAAETSETPSGGKNDTSSWNMTADYSNSIKYASALCSPVSNDNLIFIFVYTAPRNIEKRKKIRATWGSVKFYNGTSIRVAFFIGKVTSYALQLSLAKEIRLNKDMVQDKSYIDSYRNLTRKGLSALYFVTRFCPRPFRVVKVDDDTLVNPFTLVNYLRTTSPDNLDKFICPVTQASKPIRKPNSKYFVSQNEFDGEYYPMYCQGYAYTIPPKVIMDLLQAATNSTLFSMEDVYITGLLASYHNVTHHALTKSHTTTFRDGSTEDLIGKIIGRPEILFIGHAKAMVYYDLFWKLASIS